MLALVAFMVACSQFEAQGPDDVNLENAEELASAFSMDPYGLGLENARVPLEGKGTASEPVSDGGITPYIITGTSGGGNRTCDEVATAYGIGSFENSFEQINTPFTNNTATFGLLTATTDGTFVSWSIEVPEGYCVKYVAAVVKGGNDANVYFYEGDVSGDSGLASPGAGGSGGAASLSNLRFCYTLEEKPDAPIVEGDEECFVEDLVLRATLADGVTIPEGYTLQWYKKVNGEYVALGEGEEPILDEVGSIDYYAAFVNGCSSEMSNAATLTINPLPGPPTGGDQDEEVCDFSKLTATVKDVPDGVSIVWYDAPTGGNVVTDPSLVYDPSGDEVQTATFYAEAVNDETECVSATRTMVTLTLRPCTRECYDDESATGRGNAFTNRRPATWFQWNTRGELITGVDLVYGRQLEKAGSVTISGPDGGFRTITVTLDPGFRFAQDADGNIVSGALKVFASNTQFTQFSGFSGALQSNTATIRVPDTGFYFVHGDIERKIDCPIAD
ncbi:hypothetical protein SAMN00777080_2101 [Aquiflexum balticum DSM 16537]|uniref:Ig-like domain-containing protein n=2 Tax=Aquiflexum TaxID=280472 RepID=A0A1W2H4G7_9BACT|nr:hypothetical protein SAMN00777080_2101 [Aquiflexum balticum DSM 16537]